MQPQSKYQLFKEKYASAVAKHPTKPEQYASARLSSVTVVNPLITQVPVYQQKHANACGYHSIANIVNFDPQGLQKLNDADLFLKTLMEIRETVASLEKNQKLKQEIENFGELERAQLEALLAQTAHPMLQGRNIVYFMFGLGYIQNCEDSLAQLERKVQEIKQGGIDRLFIILGVTVHWTVLVVDRTSQTSKFHCYYLDSMNNSLKQIFLKQSLNVELDDYCEDLRETFQILTKLLTQNNTKLSDIRFENQLREMLNNFDRVVTKNNKSIDDWLANQYAGPVIRNDVFVPMRKSHPAKLSQHNRTRFLSWCKQMSDSNKLDVEQPLAWLQQI